jgi:hypothetical protein
MIPAGLLSGLRRHKFGLAAFLIPLFIRSIPEILVGPYPIGWDTITFYVPNQPRPYSVTNSPEFRIFFGFDVSAESRRFPSSVRLPVRDGTQRRSSAPAVPVENER